jgi:hypothetical protein
MRAARASFIGIPTPYARRPDIESMIIDASSFINFSALSPFSLRSAPDAVAQWIASATGEDKEGR